MRPGAIAGPPCALATSIEMSLNPHLYKWRPAPCFQAAFDRRADHISVAAAGVGGSGQEPLPGESLPGAGSIGSVRATTRQGFEFLEPRQLLSADLTQDIVNLLDSGTTTGSVTLNDVTLGSFLSTSSVTVSFQNITQSGSDWTGTVSVSAASASLAIGSAVSAQINGESGSPGITGSYTLTNQPAGQGAYQLSASQFDLTLSHLLTAQSSDIAIDYSPTAAAGQELVQVGSLSATLLPFDNTTVTVDNLDIFDNGFSLGNATVTAPSMTLGQVLTIDQPSLTLSGVGYTDGAFTGTIGLGATTASLFPGQSAFSATVDAPSGSYSLASQTLTLSTGNLDLSVGHVLQATGSQLSFSLDDSQSPPAATFDAQQITLTSPDFPSATGTIADFSGTNAGFTIGSATLTDSTAVTLSNLLEFSSPTLTVSNFSYTPGESTPVTGTIQVGGTVNLFPGQSSFSSKVDDFSASYDIGSEVFSLQASAIDLNLGKVLTATTGPVAFTFDDSSGTPAVSFDVKNVALSSPDFPGVTGTISDLSASNSGFSVASATLSDSSAIAFGKILDVSSPSLSLTNFAYTPGALPAVTGTFTVAGTIELFPGQSSFNTTVNGFSASYDIASETFDLQASAIDLNLGKVLTATTGPVALTFDDSSGTPAVSFDVQNVSVTSPDFPGVTGTISDLSASDSGFSVASATLSDSSAIAFGKILDVSSPSLSLSNFAYTPGASPAVTGTFTVGGTIELFPGQSSFNTTVNGFSASYDVGSEVFSLQASAIDLNLGKVLTATTGPVALTFDDSSGTPAVSFDVKDVALSSTDFPGVTGTISDLSASNSGFSVASATLSDSSAIAFGKILDVSSPSLSLTNFAYTPGASPAVTGTFTVAGTIELFPGQSSFSTTVNGFSASYDIAGETFDLQASTIDLNLGKVLTATTGPVALTFDDSSGSPVVSFDVKNVSLSSPDFPGVTGTISDLSASNSGFSVASATLSDSSAIAFGKILDVSSPSLSLSNFAYTPGASPAVTGTFTVGGTIELFPGQSSFSTTVNGFSASYDIASETFGLQASAIDLNLGKVLTATTGPVAFTFDDSSGSPVVSFDVKNVSLSSPDFAGVTGTISDLSASNSGFSVASATLSDSSAIAFGSILDVSDPSLSLANFAYTPGASPAVTGTFTVGGTIELFPGQSSFSTTVDNLSASYDIGSQVFAIQASEIDLDLGQVLTAKTGPVRFTFDDSSGTPAVSFDVQNVALSSTDFPKATGTIGDLSANNDGFSIASASLSYSGAISLGDVLSITGLSLGVENFSYTTGADGASPTVGGTITFGAQSVSLFAGQPAFSTTISDPTGKSPSGLSGSYNINTQAINFQLDQVDVKVSDLLDVTADSVSVDVTPGSFGMTVGSATVSVPKLAGFQGSVKDLGITSDGFTIGKATLGFTGTITLGSVLTISNPSASISGLSYSISNSNGPQFNGDISFGLSASLNVGKVASASVSGLNVTLGLTPQDYGQFLVTANSASFTLGSYLTLTATSTPTTPLEFNTAATSGQDIVQFGTVTAQLTAGPLSVSATGQDFGIDSNGNFVALTGFGIQVSADVASGIDAASAFKWPSFLPIQVSALSLTWPDFNTDPSSFSIDISAGISTSLAGLTLSGSVQNAVFNVGDLANGQFPLTSLGGAGFQVGGTFAGVTFNAEGFLATTTGPNGQSILYGGIDGGVDIAGLAGFQIRLGLSQLGPLDIYAQVDAPIILDPDTGLALTGLSAGINFGGGLTTPDSAKDLNKVAQGVFAPTLTQWESQLATDVADQISSGASWSNPPTLLTIQGGATLFDAYASPDAFELSGNIAFDTTGKLLASGTVTMGAEVKVQGSVFIDLSQVASGKAELMMDVTAPADTPIVNAYGTVDFEFDGPVFNSQQSSTGTSTPQLGDGLVLDGSTGYGSASNINLNKTSYTVEFWSQRSTAGQEEPVIGQAPSASTTGLSIGFDTNNDFVVNSGGTTLSFPAGQDTNWHQWAVTFDMTSGTLSIYRDGVLEDSASSVNPIQAASSTLLLGKSGSIFFSGGVDEVRVWTVARTAAQIVDNLALQTPSPTTGLLADWSFSEGKGTTAADSSGNGNTMTLTGGVTWAPTTIGGASQAVRRAGHVGDRQRAGTRRHRRLRIGQRDQPEQ